MALDFPHIDPIAFEIGPIIIRWYALAYITGFIGGIQAIKYYLAQYPSQFMTKDHADNLLTWLVIGVILGGRFGYVLFYNFDYYASNPIEAFKIWQGGMAFHGGLIGIISAMALFTWKHSIPFLALCDRVAVATPIGLFFGRIANFINGELVGRPTDAPWGMIFSDGDVARHPSQIYQALTEGCILLAILLFAQRYEYIRSRYGIISGAFLIAYASMRFMVEYTRAPDAHIGLLKLGLSMGQFLCIPMALIGLGLIIYARAKATKA